MTASDRLREIWEGAITYEPGSDTEIWYVDNDLAEGAVIALSEIIAVVYAAENSGKLAGSPLEAALAVLDVKLTADGNDKEGGN